MTDLVAVAKQLQDFCEAKKWSFCIIGGLALQMWGENRVTMDVDVTLLTGFGEEEKYVDSLLEKFPSRITGAKEFALLRRVLLLESSNGIGIDISLGAFDFEASMVARATYQYYLPHLSLKICTAEDLIVTKSFADRPKDWFDIESILIRQDDLDWEYIFEQLTPIVELKEAPEILDRLKKLKGQS